MYGMMDIDNPLELKEIRIIYAAAQGVEGLGYISANALCILWVAFSETVPGTTCLQVKEDTSEIPLFLDWIKTGEDNPY